MTNRMDSEGWRPIETAPHETHILLGWVEPTTGKWECQTGFASGGKLFPNGYSTRWWHGRATHWMPLPTPPTEPTP